ncbi:hypothetical protein [Limisalsivibrio acetivorans]|uniref:hypothetical protein n=1 Tax=Limisalsivibrio acetivorans TaxID=1304888 RepID=UPI0003B4B98A|nr:hypothetical protein [Limisalsivibrio acetivorans]
MPAGPIDIQTVFNKTPVAEKVQEVQDKSAENRQAHFAQESQRQREKESETVTNVPDSENPILDDKEKEKRERERREREKRKKKSARKKGSRHIIDLEA